jgi:hypothetical protein
VEIDAAAVVARVAVVAASVVRQILAAAAAALVSLDQVRWRRLAAQPVECAATTGAVA